MTASKLEDLFLMALKDIYHGEKQIARCWRMPVGAWQRLSRPRPQ
jgi:ferritin-like metal-binding protein YciE